MLLEKNLLRCSSAVQDDLDVVVASDCRIVKQRLCRLLPQRPGYIAKPVESIPQRSPPLLVPVIMLSCVASAIGTPSLHTVSATPGRIVLNLCLRHRRKVLQKFSVIGQTNFTALLDRLQRIRQGHVAVRMVMSVAFAVGCNVDELPGRAIVAESVQQAHRQIPAIIQQAFKRNRARNWSVI